MEVGALVEVKAGQGKPLGLAESHRLQGLRVAHAELAVLLARLAEGVGLHSQAWADAQPELREGAGTGLGQGRQPFQLGQVVHHNDPGHLHRGGQILGRLVHPVDQDLLPGDAGCGGDV